MREFDDRHQVGRASRHFGVGGIAAIVRGADLLVLAETSLVDQSGASHRLGALWQDQPIVLVFLRHFG